MAGTETRAPAPSRALPEGPVVAILPWGAVFEDFLDTIDVTLHDFETEMTGGWLFNVAHALHLAGVRVVIVLSSHSVDRPSRRVHLPTGTPLLVLPAPRVLRLARQISRWRVVQQAMRRFRPFEIAMEEAMAYTATPPLRFARELRREGCSALLCQEYEYARSDVQVMIGRMMRIPVFAMFQGANRQWGFLQRLTRPVAVRQTAGFIIGARDEAQRVQQRYSVPPSNIARIYNPVDAGSFATVPRSQARAALGIPQDARVALWYGRVERHVKGLDILVDAWQTVCRQHADADLRLLMIGTGTDAGWLRQRIASPVLRGVSWRDEYIHDRRVLRLHLCAADVFVLSSRREGFPLAPVEAMACGVPVVATAVPGVPEIVEGGAAAGGLVVPIDDAPALARALGRILQDRALARRLGQHARTHAQTSFSPEVVGRALRDFMVQHGMRTRVPADA